MLDLSNTERLYTTFFQKNASEVAKQLLGKCLARQLDEKILVGKIIETEAYLAQGDLAAHQNKRRYKENSGLFKPAGYSYVHAMRQWCLLDIKTQDGSVLIRALEPLKGIEQMKVNRSSTDIANLCSGPGKLCQALQITKEHDGINLCNANSNIFLLMAKDKTKTKTQKIDVTTRIGITQDKDKLLRFIVKKLQT